MSSEQSAYINPSKTVEWGTPQDLFDELNKSFKFEVDVCATPENAKCSKFYTKENDGLSKSWGGICWMNPPYGKELGEWIKHAYESSLKGATVVCLVPARTDTRWWHNYCTKAEVLFLKGRLRFSNSTLSNSAAPFPNALVVFRPSVKEILQGTKYL